ncbi:MAG TPA: hypothetical protein PLE19_17280 [Planctomycetota bacterium]|nr:hypothetical protein [Planctomycetota bacterium]HRR83188.1 hypothetical protein [Planctomycetota bacterium]HRT97678.1 hypothetical protein [Planctomycetota bacterium]
MGKRGTVTLTEVLVITLVVGIALAAVLHVVTLRREESRRITCRNHLNCNAKAMATYLNSYGDDKWYPWPMGRGLRPDGFTGAEWFATNYWLGIHPSPACYLCPSSGDTNHDGRDLGTDRAVPGLFGSQTVSYAAMGNRSVGIYLASRVGKGASYATSKLPIHDDFPPNEVMASDDTEGTPNHGGQGMAVLFFDSHVEYWTRDRIDPELSVGVSGTEPVHLRN